MMRKIKVIYVVSDDVDWTPVEVEEIVLAPDLILETTEEEPTIFILDVPVSQGQTYMVIDRATCKRFQADFLPVSNLLDGTLSIEWLRGVSFLDLVRAFAEVPERWI
jgi:hypothetical protein